MVCSRLWIAAFTLVFLPLAACAETVKETPCAGETASNNSESGCVTVDDGNDTKHDNTTQEPEVVLDPCEHRTGLNWGGSCKDFAKNCKIASVSDPELMEISGLVVSREYDDIAWVHNDSGDGANIYAIELSTGNRVATVELKDVSAYDIEDISLSQCDDGWCIFLADIGDNLNRRESITIHRFVEPDPFAGTSQSIDVQSMTATLEHGPADAETLLSEGEELYILTKTMGESILYHARFQANAKVEFQAIEEIHWTERVPKGSSALMTGGDFQTSPPRVILRVYFGMFEFVGEEGQSLPQVLQNKGRAVPAGNDLQGEAVAYGPAGYYHIAESPNGKPVPVNYVPCAPETP